MEPGRGRSRPPWRDASGAGDLWRLCQAVYMATIPTWLGGVGGAAIPTSGAVGGCGAQRPAAGLFYRKSVPACCMRMPQATHRGWALSGRVHTWRVGVVIRPRPRRLFMHLSSRGGIGGSRASDMYNIVPTAACSRKWSSVTLGVACAMVPAAVSAAAAAAAAAAVAAAAGPPPSAAVGICASMPDAVFDRGTNIDSAKVAPSECCARCQANTKCKSWNTHGGTCYLHPSIGKVVYERGSVAGVPSGSLPPKPPPGPPGPLPPHVPACALGQHIFNYTNTHPWQLKDPTGSNSHVQYIGTFATFDECEHACRARPSKNCTSWVRVCRFMSVCGCYVSRCFVCPCCWRLHLSLPPFPSPIYSLSLPVSLSLCVSLVCHCQ
jgi:hypothetical protein